MVDHAAALRLRSSGIGGGRASDQRGETRGSVFKAVRLTISRAEISRIVGSFHQPDFPLSVLPVGDQIDESAAPDPNDGASSIAPIQLDAFGLARRPLAKWRRVRPGYFWSPRAGWLAPAGSSISDASRATDQKRHSPMPRSDRRVKIGVVEFPSITSEPTIPTCARAMGDKGGQHRKRARGSSACPCGGRQRPARGFWGRRNSASGSDPRRAPLPCSCSSRMRPLGTAKVSCPGIVVNYRFHGS